MLYKNFEHDFVERTINNLKWIDTKNSIDKTNKDSTIFYEFTNLINQCLGLIILVKELSDDSFVKSLPQAIEHYSLRKADIDGLADNDLILLNVLTHLRNSIAHGHIQQSDDGNDEITEVVFWDANPWELKKENKDMTIDNAEVKIFLTFEKLKNFANTIANEYLIKKRSKQ
jgi:hypothetical protein